MYSLHSIFIAAAIDVSEGESRATVVSIIYGASFFGTFAPFVAGIIADASETRNAFIFAGVMVLISALLLAFLKLPRTANLVAAGG